MFSKVGKVKCVDMKRDYAFVEYEDNHHADEAVTQMNGKDLDGRSLVVQPALPNRRGQRSSGSADVCYNCGQKGHW
jgi:arginine/serine-rich splicing factor 7